MNEPPLCLSCGAITEAEYAASPGLSRMREWREQLAAFWAAHPVFFHVLRAPLLLFSLGVACAYLPETREWTGVFVLLAVVVLLLRESLPLAPVPFNVYNTVTSREGAYWTAARMVPLFAMALAFCGVFVVLAERFGNIAFHESTDYSASAPSYWGTDAFPWLGVFALGAPFLFFCSLTLSARFVSPRVEGAKL